MRSAQAVAAWNRHGGSHSGPKRPEFDETDEGLNDYEDEKNEQETRKSIRGRK